MIPMKILAINGGPRKNWNTATLLKNALEGAAAQGAETELIHLYDLNYKGCISCFSCKLKGGSSYGKCAVQDDLAPVLAKIETCDALVLGSPIYLGEVTGALRSFLERLVFQYLVYDKDHSSIFGKQIKAGFIYTMNVSEQWMSQIGYKERLATAESAVKRIFGDVESLYSTDTMQFTDYSKYVSDMFDAEAKAKRHREVFPEDCKKAYEMGVRLVEK
jgi:multimeric flavodoxin WrbA